MGSGCVLVDRLMDGIGFFFNRVLDGTGAFFYRFMTYLEKRQQLKEAEHAQSVRRESRYDNYNEIAFILWYDVLVNQLNIDIDKLNEGLPFRIFDFGTTTIRYNAVVALDSNDVIVKFQNLARITLCRKGYNVIRVSVHKDCILVKFHVS